MDVSYDSFTAPFLAKVTEYDFLQVDSEVRAGIVDGYLRRAMAKFQEVCPYDFVGNADDETRQFAGIKIDDNALEEVLDIVSDGMIVQWMRPYLYRQENLENALNTRDFTTYSPANLLANLNTAYKDANQRFINECREYSFRHGDLTVLHT